MIYFIIRQKEGCRKWHTLFKLSLNMTISDLKQSCWLNK